MALKARIEQDLKTALLGGDRFVADTLRGLKAVILNEEVAQNKRDTGLDDDTIEKLIAREVKKRHESASTYDDANRTDLSESERAEADIISRYLPEPISEEEIQKTIEKVIAELGLTGPQAMGQVIGAVKKQLGNAADGATVAKMVKDALA